MKILHTLSQFWSSCSGRERAFLTAAAAVVAAAALYAFLWDPGIAARRRLSAALPTLRAQAEAMRRQQLEISALRKSLGTRTVPADLKALLQASAARTAFARSVERIEAASPGRAIFAAAPVDFDAWLEWAETLQRELGVRIEACRIVALDQPGLVRIESTFAAGGAAAR